MRGGTTKDNVNTNKVSDKTSLPGAVEGRQASVSVSSRSSSDEEEALLVRNIETGEVQNIDAVYDQFEYSTFSDGQVTPKTSEGGDDLLSSAERETQSAAGKGGSNKDWPAKEKKVESVSSTKKVSVSLDSFRLNRVLGKEPSQKFCLYKKRIVAQCML